MKDRAFWLSFIFILLGLIGCAFFTPTRFPAVLPEAPPLPIKQRVILLPLDSRPPTLNFPVELGALGNIQVIIPPKSLLDQNTIPGNQEALFNWLEKESETADAIVLSTDMLLHGGLVASRRISPDILTAESRAEWEKRTSKLIERLEFLRKKNPNLHFLGFSIIPRQLVSEEPPARDYQPHLYHYSFYADRVSQFEGEKDTTKFLEWREILPEEVRLQYHELFDRNLILHEKLILATEKGLFDRLIIGQDDAQPFGIPNWYRKRAVDFAKKHGVLETKVFFTGGTDELAQLLVARYALSERKDPFSVYTYYTEKTTFYRILPYMSETLGTNVDEKFRILGIVPAVSPDDANLILAVHGGYRNPDLPAYRQAAKQLNSWVREGKAVSIMDVNRDFNKPESLLPILIDEKVPLLNLAGYAGWNTASNSLGTALSQGILFTIGMDGSSPSGSMPERRNLQGTFLVSRFLDDWAYQKELQTKLNYRLRFLNYNPYALGINDQRIRQELKQQIHYSFDQLYQKQFSQIPYTFLADEGERRFFLRNVQINIDFPWYRTFEIDLKVTPLWEKAMD